MHAQLALDAYRLVGQAVAYADQPVAAVAAVRQLREQLDRCELEAVRAMRALGMPWATVGQALGVSRQAADNRFRARLDLDDPAPRRRPGPPAGRLVDDLDAALHTFDDLEDVDDLDDDDPAPDHVWVRPKPRKRKKARRR